MIVVVDSSVMVKGFVEEEESEFVSDILTSTAEIHVSDLLFAEVANVFWRCWRTLLMSEDQVVGALVGLEPIISSIHPSAALTSQALAISCALDHPLYDCFYLALAERLSAPLVTADRRLIRKVAGTTWENDVQTISQLHALLTR